MQRKAPYVNSELGEDTALDKLIVMDDVSGLADKSDIFFYFLTVSRKYGLSCVYIFHTIYPNKENWEMIMSQTHIFNFYPGSVHNGTILRTVSLFGNKYKNTYVPKRNVWLSTLYFNVSNSKQKQRLTIDTREINDLGPGKFRTQADNGTRQICYYNRNKYDTSFVSFLATRKLTSQIDIIKFSIDKVTANINSSDVSYSVLGDELKNINNDNIQSKLEQLGNDNTISRWPTNKDRTDNLNDKTQLMDMDESAKSQDFFQDNNAIKVKYTTSRIKSRNFLLNFAYVGINKENYYNRNLIFDVFPW